MKLLSLFFLTIFLGKSCDVQKKQDLETTVIEYVANTRGFYKKITVQNQMVLVSKDRKGNDKPVEIKISDSDWKKLIADFQEINLDEIPNLKAPSEKRFYDGAAIANLRITYKDKTYESTSFDHGNPPAEIKKLVVLINQLVKEKE
ncbi:hypothetical protein [Flavobacterium luteum]|uniref:Uncharacterized protein n=1 Tax=Flavobacterium luteum TaxID=2026654 RepID=A0A7J5AHP3_9FLAO|nr:hypothetical protein [Flavobacterium luteum]KAB1157121.1 hypothetical protein F6464_07190 [Flavobacterium luteum]